MSKLPQNKMVLIWFNPFLGQITVWGNENEKGLSEGLFAPKFGTYYRENVKYLANSADLPTFETLSTTKIMNIGGSTTLD